MFTSLGFICVDGTSLTICEVDYDNFWFTFMLVPHTQQSVILPNKEIGDQVAK
jgi:riboflavin synthase